MHTVTGVTKENWKINILTIKDKGRTAKLLGNFKLKITVLTDKIRNCLLNPVKDSREGEVLDL